MKILPLVVMTVIASVTLAQAGPASDLVKSFYTPVGYEPDPKLRDRFVDPVKALFDKNDKVADQGDVCIDWVPSIDAQDLDQAEIDRTLKLDEKVDGDAATVTATFNLFPDQADSKRTILWSLKQVDGVWKVSDIASPQNGWTLSELGCGEQ